MTLLLPERPHPRDLDSFRTDALARLASLDGLAVDARQVAHLPLAWVQLLIAASREAQATGNPVRIVNPSFAFLFSFEALGLQPDGDLFTLEYAP